MSGEQREIEECSSCIALSFHNSCRTAHSIGEAKYDYGWISLRVEDPHAEAEWYKKLGFEIVGARPEFGSVAIGTKDKGRIMVLLAGPPLGHPDRLQVHFAVPDVDIQYERLKRAGIQFKEPPKDMPWRWRHAYTQDPAGRTVEICSPLPDAGCPLIPVLCESVG